MMGKTKGHTIFTSRKISISFMIILMDSLETGRMGLPHARPYLLSPSTFLSSVQHSLTCQETTPPSDSFFSPSVGQGVDTDGGELCHLPS